MFYILRRRGLGLGSTKAIQELSQHEINVVRNDKFLDFKSNDVVLRWGCTTSFNEVSLNTKLLNTRTAITLVNNKRDFRNLLQQLIPELVPKTWFSHLSVNIRYPCILRPQSHCQGKELYFCTDYEQLVQILDHLDFLNDRYYISEYINKVAEYRVCFIQGRVAWVANKVPANPSNIAWNVAQGSKFENVSWKSWPIDVIETAYKAYQLSGLYLGGVDIMVDKDGRSYVLEINSAPSHTSPYRKKCTTKCIDYGITNNDFTHLSPNENFKKYSKWIHPALK
jgi:glutathione synthase/RimK-type ligase-like ATP-grasp enzyme